MEQLPSRDSAVPWQRLAVNAATLGNANLYVAVSHLRMPVPISALDDDELNHIRCVASILSFAASHIYRLKAL